MLPLLEAVAAGLLVGVLNRVVAHIQTHGLSCPTSPPPGDWDDGGDRSSSCSSQSSAVVEATAHFDPGAHFLT